MAVIPSYRALPNCFYQPVTPCLPKKLGIIKENKELTADLGFNSQSNSLSNFINQALYSQHQYISMAYAGHQFGQFTILGDGRACLLEERYNGKGQLFDIHLKGCGPTAYSRHGDGKAALGPMLREYLISESMHYLNIPTSRSLAVITTGENIEREDIHPGSMLFRVAKSHIRIGTFEYAARQVDNEPLKALFEYTCLRHYPECMKNERPALSFLSLLLSKHVQLIVDWERVGFIHGVMNTDNTSIAGETIDYGPCAFLDDYHPEAVFSAIDPQGRYAFGQQAHILHWNLARLAECLLPLIDPKIDQAIQQCAQLLESFPNLYASCWLDMMRKKLGLVKESPEDRASIKQLIELMQNHQLDYTNTFLKLEKYLTQAQLDEEISRIPSLKQWVEIWYKKIVHHHTKEESLSIMRKNNPAVIPRNHRVAQALSLAENEHDMSEFNALYKRLSQPYQRVEFDTYASKPKPQERIYKTFCGT